MKNFNNRNISFSLGSLFLFFLIFTFAARSMAQDVILNPGYISGQVQIGDAVLKDVRLEAQFETFESITWINPTEDLTSVSYNLIVNVPVGTISDYAVGARIFRLNNKPDDSFSFPYQSVNVSADQTSEADFVIETPGFIVGTLSVAGETTKYFSASLSASGPGNVINGVSRGGFQSTTRPTKNQNTYRIAVLPGDNIRFRCNGVVGGIKVDVPTVYVNVAAGETVIVNCELPLPPEPETGALEVSISMPGPLTPDSHRFQIVGSGKNITSTYNTDGTYSFNGLPVLTYRVFCDTIFNNKRQWFRHPIGSYSPATTDKRFLVIANTTTQVDIFSPQAFITGKVNITGTASTSDLGQLIVYAQGIKNTNTGDGTGTDYRVDRTTGNYELILTDGPWSLYRTYVAFINSSINAGYTSEGLTFTDFTAEQNPIIASAENPGTKDFNLDTGEVSVNFSIAGIPGTIFSNPWLRGSCSLHDENDQLVSRYGFSAYNQELQDVEIGIVKFFGMEGICTVTAHAIVAGSSVTFGKFNIGMVPGASQVIDIGGPSLTIEFPEPDLITSNESITVTGVVTDDVAVAGVTVNGVNATLASTNNPSDTAEMSFSATINNLDRGPNEITTVATDTADPAKTSSDTRTVFRDEGPPTLNWTPEDGALLLYTGATTSIDGIADDDAGIQSITVNGQVVTFLSTGNTGQPNEVSFSTSLILPVGVHFITVIATDISNRTTTQTHKITVTENRPPVANAGPDQTVEAASCSGVQVVLDGSGSSDPDGDPLTYTWTIGATTIATGISSIVNTDKSN